MHRRRGTSLTVALTLLAKTISRGTCRYSICVAEKEEDDSARGRLVLGIAREDVTPVRSTRSE